jgi:hypothetical protein
MKNILLFSVCLLFILSSCKKSGGGDGSTPANTISATVDGVKLNFSTKAIAYISQTYSMINILDINGQTGKGITNEGIDINVAEYFPNVGITKGTYLTSGPPPSPAYSYLSYYKQVPDSNYVHSYFTDISKLAAYVTTVTISSITDTNVQGTFSGTVYNSRGDSTKVITNGKFNMAISN